MTTPLLVTQLMTTPLLVTQLMTTPLLATLATKPLLTSVVATKPAVVHKTRVHHQASVYRKTAIQTQYWNSGTLLIQFKTIKRYMLQDNICKILPIFNSAISNNMLTFQQGNWPGQNIELCYKVQTIIQTFPSLELLSYSVSLLVIFNFEHDFKIHSS